MLLTGVAVVVDSNAAAIAAAIATATAAVLMGLVMGLLGWKESKESWISAGQQRHELSIGTVASAGGCTGPGLAR